MDDAALSDAEERQYIAVYQTLIDFFGASHIKALLEYSGTDGKMITESDRAEEFYRKHFGIKVRLMFFVPAIKNANTDF